MIKSENNERTAILQLDSLLSARLKKMVHNQLQWDQLPQLELCVAVVPMTAGVRVGATVGVGVVGGAGGTVAMIPKTFMNKLFLCFFCD